MNIKKPSKREKYIEPGEFRKLLEHASNEKWYMLLYITGNLGLRVGEAVRLRREDFHFKDGFVNVPTLKQGGHKGEKAKGKIQRGQLPDVYDAITAPESFLNRVSIYFENYKIKTWIFIEKDKLHIPEWKAQRIFKAVAKNAGLNPRYSIHALRHCRGIAVYKAYKDIRAVQALLRHRNINSSVVYTEMDLDAKRELTDNMEVVE
jgi:integrase